jgi:hypothetical protein
VYRIKKLKKWPMSNKRTAEPKIEKKSLTFQGRILLNLSIPIRSLAVSCISRLLVHEAR